MCCDEKYIKMEDTRAEFYTSWGRDRLLYKYV